MSAVKLITVTVGRQSMSVSESLILEVGLEIATSSHYSVAMTA